MKLLKIILPVVFVILFSFLAASPIFTPGFFPIHDNTQVARVFEMTKSLREGFFPVRWVPDLGYGYGYPIFNFYAPLSYYVGALFQLLGFDALFSTKLMMAAGIIFAGVSMYLLIKEFIGKWAGIAAAALYVFAPYHAVDIFVRGDVAEFWAYALLPLPFLGLYKIYKSKGKFEWVTLSALGYAGVILSHNLTAMMISPFLLVFAVFLISKSLKDKYTSAAIFSSVGLGLMLSAFYFLPALSEQRYTNVISQIGGGADYKDHFVCLAQLWQSQWGFGGSAPGCVDGISFMIGKIHLLFAAVALILLTVCVYLKKIKRKEKQFFILCLLGFASSVFLMLPFSKIVWDHIPLMAYLQYSWRFLVLVSFFCAILGSMTVYLISKLSAIKNLEVITCIIILVTTVLLNIKVFVPQYTFAATQADFINEKVLKWQTSKISDEYMPRDFPKPQNENDVVKNRVSYSSEDLTINKLYENSALVKVDLTANKQTKLHFNIAYFPAWRLTVDGQSRGSIVSKGYDVSLAVGKHVVQMEFMQTNIEKISNSLTVLGILCMFAGIIFWNKKFLNG